MRRSFRVMDATRGAASRAYFLLRYAYPADILQKRAPHRALHLARLSEEAAAGRLLLGGVVPADAPREGLLCFYATRAEVEAFVTRDPYWVERVAESFRIDEWAVVIGSAMQKA